MSPSWNDAPAKVKRHLGFTLLEVVVAFAILAVSLGVAFQAFGTGSNNARLSEQYTLAALMAESQLAAIGVETPLRPGTGAGKLPNGFRWRSEIKAMDETADARRRSGTQLFEISLTVTWGDAENSRSVSLQTFRLGKVPQR